MACRGAYAAVSLSIIDEAGFALSCVSAPGAGDVSSSDPLRRNI